MQWLIDLIIDAIGIPPTFIDRGDPAASDFGFGDFVRDGAWHELDLSGIIPTNATCVLLNFFFAGDTVGRAINFRTPGNVNTVNIQDCHQDVANLPMAYGVLVHPDSNRKIEYVFEISGWFLASLAVRGWWL